MMWPDQMGTTAFCDPTAQQHALKAMNAMSMWGLEQCHPGYAATSKVDPGTTMPFPLNHFAQQLSAAQQLGFTPSRSNPELSPTPSSRRKKPIPIPEESKDEVDK
ncbi:unnamed protein product, partial [Mesorhabditis belari]|uniref:Uncharacterized protein n=1 Tax=Mesorhabditis belari TaxID=2138241 RepID=A0AAF3JB91_9BILA